MSDKTYHYVVEGRRTDRYTDKASGTVKALYPEAAYKQALEEGCRKIYLEPRDCIVSTLVPLD